MLDWVRKAWKEDACASCNEDFNSNETRIIILESDATLDKDLEPYVGSRFCLECWHLTEAYQRRQTLYADANDDEWVEWYGNTGAATKAVRMKPHKASESDLIGSAGTLPWHDYHATETIPKEESSESEG